MLPVSFLFDVLAAASPFWSGVDALCTDPAALSAIEPEKLGDAAEAREQIFVYCKVSTAPRFAARPEAERRARLDRIYAALGKAPPPVVSLPEVPTQQQRLAFLDRVTTNEDAELGLAGQRVLAAVITELCKLPDTEKVLPSTCAAANSSLTLTKLRAAVLLDLADATLRAADKALKPAEVQVAALFALVIQNADLARAADRLEAAVPDGSTCGSSANRDACEYSVTTMRVLSLVLTRLLRDGPKLDRDLDHYENVVEEILRDEAKKPDLTLPPLLKTETKKLVDAVKNARIVTGRARATPVEAEKANLVALERAAVVAALGAAFVRGTNPDAAKGFISATEKAVETTNRLLDLLAANKPRDFFEATKPILAMSTTAAQQRALGAAASLASAKDADDLRRAAREALVPVPAWADRFVLDLNVAPPESKSAHGSSNFSINGDATVGYNGDHVGFLAHADTAYYDLAATRNSALTERYAGSLDVWGLIDITSKVAIEPRLSAGFAYYGTLADDATTGVDRQTNQDSIMGRGSGVLGVRLRPHPRIAVAVSGGGGAQYEDYYRVLQTSLGDQGTTFNASIGFKGEAHLRFQWTIVPSIVSFRARGDLTRFSMRRSDQAVTFSLGQQTVAQAGVLEVDQTELFARGFIDADIARFFGFVPAVHGGVNMFSLSGNNNSTSATIPVFGIGIRREAL